MLPASIGYRFAGFRLVLLGVQAYFFCFRIDFAEKSKAGGNLSLTSGCIDDDLVLLEADPFCLRRLRLRDGSGKGHAKLSEELLPDVHGN